MKETTYTLEDLPLSNNWMFAEVMRDKETCRLFIEALLKKEVAAITFIDSEVVKQDLYTAKGIRMDIYFKDELDVAYNIEMQTSNKIDFPKRVRYYQGEMDRENLPRNARYKDLPNTYIIFVCTFDYFKQGYPVYELVRSPKQCPDRTFEDGAKLFVLNAAYDIESGPEKANDISPAVLEYLQIVRNESIIFYEQNTELGQRVVERVETVRKQNEGRTAMLTMTMLIDDAKDEGIQEGILITAKTMKQNGYDPEAIKKITGLSLEEIELL